MSSIYFFKELMYSIDLIEDLESIFNDSEGLFPADQLEVYISNNTLPLDHFLYDLSRYAVFRGVEIAKQDSFFATFESKLTSPHPGITFWRAYDALIRGNITIFKQLWTFYVSIELKNFTEPFIHESIVIPEDPLFLNVEEFVHDQQQRIIKHFILHKDSIDDIPDQEYDKLLQDFLGEYSLLLSFFRLFQSSFERNIGFSDLDNLLTLITEENLTSLGPYWESKFLSAICYWKVSLGLVFDVVDNLTRLKNLNHDASNFLLESQIFHIEALIAFKNNSPDSSELLNSAYFLAKEYNFFYQAIEVLLTKLELETDSISQNVESIFSLTSNQNYPLIRARIYALLGSYYIHQKNWQEAEKNLLQSSKLVQGSYDKKTYYQVIADFSYVLVVTRQLQEALESSVVLLDDNVYILYRIRGFYLYGLTLLLLDRKTESIEILEEGIRVALTHEEHISLPWFYEILQLVYVSLNDIENASRYSNLTYKAYFESSSSDSGYRSKIASSYILALGKDYGRALTQITGMLSETSATDLQFEAYSALETIILGSKEQIKIDSFKDVWNSVELLETDSKLRSLLNLKKDLITNSNPIDFFSLIEIESSTEQFTEKSLDAEIYLLWLLFNKKSENSINKFFDYTEKLVQFFSSLHVKFISTDYTIDVIKKIASSNKINLKEKVIISSEDEFILFSGIFVINLLRIILDNLPFNFLI